MCTGSDLSCHNSTNTLSQRSDLRLNVDEPREEEPEKRPSKKSAEAEGNVAEREEGDASAPAPLRLVRCLSNHVAIISGALAPRRTL